MGQMDNFEKMDKMNKMNKMNKMDNLNNLDDVDDNIEIIAEATLLFNDVKEKLPLRYAAGKEYWGLYQFEYRTGLFIFSAVLEKQITQSPTSGGSLKRPCRGAS